MPVNKLRLKILTPSRILFDDDVDMVIMRAVGGDFAALPGHTPYTTILDFGVTRIQNNSVEQVLSVQGGFAEIQPDKVTILSDSAEWPDEIDIRRAELAKERAQRQMNELSSEVEVHRASFALRRALVRLEVSTYPLIMKKR